MHGQALGLRQRFYRGDPIDPTGAEADEMIRAMAEHGVDAVGLDRMTAFSEVCRVTISPGEILVARGSPPSFVYVPTGSGLVVRPDGGTARGTAGRGSRVSGLEASVPRRSLHPRAHRSD